MYEKVNPEHPDKIADRIAGAIVDLCYSKQDNPKCAIEVLIGHKHATILGEVSIRPKQIEITEIVKRIAPEVDYLSVGLFEQDKHLADNQAEEVRCGDNGIFKGMPITEEQEQLAQIAHEIYDEYKADGKYILDLARDELIICQSKAHHLVTKYNLHTIYNPLGD